MIFLRACVGALAVAASAPSSSLAFTAHHHHRQCRTNQADHSNSSSHLHSFLFATRGGSVENNDVSPTSSSSPSHTMSKLDTLLAQAQQHLQNKDADGAFATLAQAYGVDPTSSKVSALFESCLGLKVELAEKKYYSWKDGLEEDQQTVHDDHDGNSNLSEKELNEFFQDRMGLSSLFIDREYYDEAGMQLRKAIEEATFWLHYTLLHEASAAITTPLTPSTQLSQSTDFTSTRFQHWQPPIDRAQYMLYRTNAACCHWDTYFDDGDKLRQSILLNHDTAGVARLLHPFDALKFPCISLELASNIATSYAHRSLETVGVDLSQIEKEEQAQQSIQRRTVTANRHDPPQLERMIRIGYISPDFTSRHPLAFLMQHVFRYHDKSKFQVNIYSLSSTQNTDDGQEVQAIIKSSDQFTHLSPSSMSPMEMYQQLMQDELDILVDLCGYAGTSVVSEIMASRCKIRQEQHQNDGQLQQQGQRAESTFPIHVSYMGFPGSVGSSKVWDYSVFDKVVIPPDELHVIRQHYKEAIVYMPHCYFVNSHKTVVKGPGDGIMVANDDERSTLRVKYGIHPSAFVYCCHSRPDKIDPSTLRSWMRAIMRVRTEVEAKMEESDDGGIMPVLWLLRSGDEMEQNLRNLVRQEFGMDAEESLIFADVAGRNEHLKRLGIADVFLDTPAYNAHTLGCDALYMGVPMITLLCNLEQSHGNNESADADPSGPGNEVRSIATEKLASRVGASLLEAVDLGELVYPGMAQYEDAMVRCALYGDWFSSLCQRLRSSKESSPLFDTERWVRNLEAALYKMAALGDDGCSFPDISVLDGL